MFTESSANGSSPTKAELLDLIRSILETLNGKVTAITVAKLRHLVTQKASSQWNARPGLRKRVARLIPEAVADTDFEIHDCEVMNCSQYGVELLFDSERDDPDNIIPPDDWKAVGIKQFAIMARYNVPSKSGPTDRFAVVWKGQDVNENKLSVSRYDAITGMEEITFCAVGSTCKDILVSPSFDRFVPKNDPGTLIGLCEVYSALSHDAEISASWELVQGDTYFNGAHFILERAVVGWYRQNGKRVMVIYTSGCESFRTSMHPKFHHSWKELELEMTKGHFKYQIWIPRCSGAERT